MDMTTLCCVSCAASEKLPDRLTKQGTAMKDMSGAASMLNVVSLTTCWTRSHLPAEALAEAQSYQSVLPSTGRLNARCHDEDAGCLWAVRPAISGWI